MSIALRLRFMMHELGQHQARIEFHDPLGGEVMPPFERVLDVSNVTGDTGTGGLVLNGIGTVFRYFGKYELKLWVDGEPRASLPLYVKRAD